MTLFWKHVTQRLTLSVITLLLIVLLAACSGLGSLASSPTPTPPPPPPPTPTPTLAVTAYTGSGYTVSYPKGWTKSLTAGQMTFQDVLGANAFGVVVVANPNGATPPSAVLDATLTGAVKGADMTKTSPANLAGSVPLAGDTWMQKGTIGTVSKGGMNGPFEVVVLAISHPANSPQTQLFVLVYAGPVMGSTLVDEQIFQAMLASFKFTS